MPEESELAEDGVPQSRNTAGGSRGVPAWADALAGAGMAKEPKDHAGEGGRSTRGRDSRAPAGGWEGAASLREGADDGTGIVKERKELAGDGGFHQSVQSRASEGGSKGVPGLEGSGDGTGIADGLNGRTGEGRRSAWTCQSWTLACSSW